MRTTATSLLTLAYLLQASGSLAATPQLGVCPAVTPVMIDGQLVEPAGGYRPYGIISDDSLVSGLSNFDIYWHQARGARRVLPSAQHLWRRTASSAGTVLAEQEGGLAALVRVRVGTGLLVLDQITWDRQTTFKSQAERYFSTLATNAGIAFAPAGVQSNVRADDFHMIDLAVSAER